MDRLPRQPKQFRGTLPTLPLLRVDDILKMFGAYGRFQVSVVLLLNLVNLFWASQLLSLMFISTVPPFHCVVDGLPTSVDVGGNVTLPQCTIVYYDTDVNVTTDCEQWAYSKQWPHTIVGEASGITAFVLRTEWLPSNARIFGVFFLGGYTWSLGVALLAIGSYLMPNWRHLQLAISVPSVLLWSFH
ncbi:PREDICTED: uncharacterized protein LOC106818201, partial [Priapulus caudatus]|uniref:Uncharacterized protein LOC106818201 n=1 Tax=Priapulus caudatus TaxID=37621 RepID=A0ABM1F1U1_PRICU